MVRGVGISRMESPACFAAVSNAMAACVERNVINRQSSVAVATPVSHGIFHPAERMCCA